MKHSNESLNKAICSSISGTTIYQNQLHEGNSQKWTFTDVGDGYYTIRTNYSSALYYLGVISDSTALDVDVGLRSGALTDGMKWKIGITEVGAYKLM